MKEHKSKEKLLKVAISLFSAKGFRGTSIRDIANAMGMSISNIYHFFGNKEGLWLAILEYSSGGIVKELQKISELDMDPVNRFKLLVDTHVRLSDEKRQEGKIFFIDEEHLSAEGNKVNKRIQRTILGIYINALEQISKIGYLKNQNLKIMAFNILGVINWQLRWYRHGGPLSLKDISQEIISFILHGILSSDDLDKLSDRYYLNNALKLEGVL
jgi:TetR/AcrR family transcriptional regulator, cholesterol catabolism regulator